MAKLRILVPESTTNYIYNPALRYDTTGWNSFNSTISRSLNQAHSGIASLRVVTNGSLVNEGAYFRVNTLQGISKAVTVSAYVRGNAIVRIRLVDNPNGKEFYSRPVSVTDDRWTRLVVTGFSTGSNDMRLYVETAKNSAQAATFYVDDAQMETKAYPTTYCDGDQEGCQWNGVYHNSTSFRAGDTRAGGKWVDLNDDPDLYYTTIGGLGVAPIRNNTQPYSDAPGSFHQSYKVLDRSLNIVFHAKNKSRYNCEPALTKLHSLRQSLFELVKPDLTAGGQEFLMEYQDGAYPVYFRARYDTGLEGEWDVRNQWTMSFPVRFLIVSPFITQDTYDVANLNIRDRLTVNYAVRRIDGQWLTMNGGHNNQILDFAIGPRGQIYAVGEFTRSNNDTSATDPQIYSNYVSYWDGTQWQRLGVGANNVVRGIAVAPNGYIYVTGDFTTIGGVAANYVAYWNGSSWNAMGTGLNGAGYAVSVASDGTVYVGGAFTTAGSANARYFAIWNGSSWTYGGLEGGLNAAVYTIAISDDATQVYVGGAFTDEFGSPGNLELQYVGLYDPTTNQFYDVGDGFDDVVRKLKIAPSGRLYACGDFTQTAAVDPDTMLYIAYFNGTAWFPLGIGANNVVRNIDITPDERLVAVGDFTRIGSVDANYLAYWNGATWAALDIELENSASAVVFDQYGNIYVSPDGTLADVAKRTTVTNNGTAKVSPILYMKGPLTLRWIENQTSKKRVFCDMTVLQDEEVILDFGRGKVTSSVRGNLAWAIQAGSDMRAWTLLPKDNVIAVLCTSDINAVMQIGSSPRFWSADSTAKLDSFA